MACKHPGIEKHSGTGGRIAGPGGAAEILGMKRTSLYTRMRTLGLSR